MGELRHKYRGSVGLLRLESLLVEGVVCEVVLLNVGVVVDSFNAILHKVIDDQLEFLVIIDSSSGGLETQPIQQFLNILLVLLSLLLLVWFQLKGRFLILLFLDFRSAADTFIVDRVILTLAVSPLMGVESTGLDEVCKKGSFFLDHLNKDANIMRDQSQIFDDQNEDQNDVGYVQTHYHLVYLTLATKFTLALLTRLPRFTLAPSSQQFGSLGNVVHSLA